MGKKLNPSSMKISKQEEKKQINTLIKALKPKVYITDSSSFKNLVQELTGFDKNINTVAPPPDNLHMQRHHVENCPVAEIQDDTVFPESSFEVSLDSGSSSSWKQDTEFSEFRDIESWLLETDQFQNYDTYAPMPHQEVCVYDCDFPGFM